MGISFVFFTSKGLVSQVVPQNELDQKVNEICRSIISKSRNVLELGKQFYHKQILMDIETAYECGATVRYCYRNDKYSLLFS